MSRAKSASRIGIWGASGSGKSTYLLDRLQGRKRVVVMDVTGDICKEGFKRCDTVDQVRLAMLADWKGFRLAFCPRTGHEPRSLNQLSGILAKAQAGYEAGQHEMLITLAVDEMADAFPAFGGLKHAPKFASLCSLGRHKGIELIGCSQRIAEVHSKFRGNCAEAIVFQNIEPNDVKRSADTLGVKVPAVENLAALQFLHRIRAKEVITGNVTPGRRKKQVSP